MMNTRKRLTMQKVSRQLFLAGKHAYQTIKQDRTAPKTILFIVGCQRSGTTLMEEIFEKDLNAKVYQEMSKLSSQHDRKLRLNPLPVVKATLERDHAPLIVLKPLVESQNTLRLLDFFPGSKALWMYRHYNDVIASRIKKSGPGNGLIDMRYLAENRPNWRTENVAPEVREVVLQHYSEAMSPYDAAALYWYVRNSLFFSLGLDQNARVMVEKYEEFVVDPMQHMRRIYGFLNQPFPEKNNVAEVHTSSVGKGNHIALSPAVEHLCQELLDRLDGVYYATTGATPVRIA
jgi:hypothetical protein